MEKVVDSSRVLVNNRFLSPLGTFTAEGIKYSGGWKKGQFEGKGTLVRINFTYVGRWKDNKQQGLGVATWKDGTSYGQSHCAQLRYA